LDESFHVINAKTSDHDSENSPQGQPTSATKDNGFQCAKKLDRKYFLMACELDQIAN